jgi:hypothetical protein
LRIGVSVVAAVNVGLLIYLSGHRRPQLLLSPGFVVADVVLAAALYVWVARHVIPGHFFHPEWDALWLYMMGTCPVDRGSGSPPPR